jgi:hypothetical protein
MHLIELSYYIRKMMSIERKVLNKKKLLWNIEWTRYQRKAAKLCSLPEASDDQKRLVFRHI